MKLVIQRVTHAEVRSEGELCGSIGKGYVVLVGVANDDTEEIVKKMAEKLAVLRINEDENGKMNLSIKDVGGSVLSVSQFTLYADCRKGRRPGFEKAARPEYADRLYEYFNSVLRENGLVVETGRFQTEMKVLLENDGPVTIVLDSAEIL
ncbi:MAG: D-tyrosyl-tRNA(Tyr) deacylase [Erysipelotrichaceae bacterium]|nr:D-tyrosyl-tRNA(Tyr) deacylase [Erysipelotrichaceae bacterium]MBQ9986745.1 D-tyrosyl-tRNA(Tyr) deacylase [Erysipelotrichales bacterium]